MAARADALEDNVHPDLHFIDPEFFVENFSDSSHIETQMPVDVPAFRHQPATAKALTELEAENEVSVKQESDPDSTSASPTMDASSPAGKLETEDADDGPNELSDEDDDLAEQDDDDIWENALPHGFGDEVEGVRSGECSLDAATLAEFLEFDLQEIESETESAQWEDLLDLDLYEEDPVLPFPLAEEETISDGQKLDEYAARLVSQMRSIKLDERSRLHGRLKVILEEFPFSATYRALLRLLNEGTTLEDLEDAFELKCLWRESPWLWAHRRFNRMQQGWETEGRSNYRNALSWKLAIELILRVGRVEAERRIFDDWLNEWLQMQPGHSAEGARMDPRFWSYAAFLNFDHEDISLADSESWYYEEPVDVQPLSSFSIADSEGQIWRFEPKDGRCDNGFLSRLPLSKRVALQAEAKAKEASEDA
ncbi:hypothetical protein EYE35_05545 [Cereibacter sphaeroides]|nr:hypothetical protein EYE35_05545 [Cereibacter sphaeroides]